MVLRLAVKKTMAIMYCVCHPFGQATCLHQKAEDQGLRLFIKLTKLQTRGTALCGEYQKIPHFVPKNPPFWRKMYQKTQFFSTFCLVGFWDFFRNTLRD